MRSRAVGVTCIKSLHFFFDTSVKYHLKLSSEHGVEVNRGTKQAMDSDIKLPLVPRCHNKDGLDKLHLQATNWHKLSQFSQQSFMKNTR